MLRPTVSNLVQGLIVILLLIDVLRNLNASGVIGAKEAVCQAPPLDSFSTPAVALAVLNGEAQRLLMVYGQSKDGAPMLPGAQAQGTPSLEHTRRIAAHSACNSAASSSITPIAQLDAKVAAFKEELNCRLMWVYSENDLNDEFLRRYLQLLGERPGSLEVLQWLKPALDCAHACGRTEELMDSIRHVIRFHGDLERVVELRRRVDRCLSVYPSSSKPDTR